MPTRTKTFDTVTEAVASYEKWLARTGLADGTRAVYLRHTETFAQWVDAQPDYDGAVADPHVRDYAMRDYRKHLLTVKKFAPSTVGLHLASLNSFYEWTSLGKAKRGRATAGFAVEQDTPEPLTEAEQRKLLRAAERRGTRDLALVGAGLFVGLRVSEIAALNLDDVKLRGERARRQVVVRHSKGGSSRAVSIENHPQVVRMLGDWIDERVEKFGDEEDGPIFVGRTGRRVSIRTVQHVVTSAGRDAGLDISPHVLRHTFGSRYIEAGGTIPGLQKLLGHRDPKTTSRYAQSTNHQVDEVMARMAVDY